VDGSIIAFAPRMQGTASQDNVACPPSNCTCCKLREACVLEECHHESVATRLRVKRGEALFRAGDRFRLLYIVHSGFFKTSSLTEDGRDQVTGFHMGGEVIGMDGIEDDHHKLTAIALEDSNVCSIPFSALESTCSREPMLQHRLFKLMSKEIVRNQEIALLLGSMRAEERVAAFLLDLSRRLQERGYAGSEFHLRMTREEIGSYLGLKLETVSRTFSKFQEMGLFEVSNKHISGLDRAGLEATMEEAGLQRAAARA